MLDKLSLEDLERIGTELGNNRKTFEEKQTILTAEAQKLVREGLASPENLTQFGVGKSPVDPSSKNLVDGVMY
jgi:hypothetical protein